MTLASSFSLVKIVTDIRDRQADISRIPKYPPLRPDFMCPGPGVNVAEDISLLETATNVQGNDDDDDGPQIHYYKTKKVLGHLYRAIDERTFLGELKQSMRTSRPKDGDIMQLVWAHVQREAAAFQWKHHVETAQEIKDLFDSPCHVIAARSTTDRPDVKV